MTDRTAPDGLPELPVVAWLIEYGRPADPVRCVYLHNAIADYRERDPGATSQTLIRLSDARQALAVQQGEIERYRAALERIQRVHENTAPAMQYDMCEAIANAALGRIYRADAALEQSK